MIENLYYILDFINSYIEHNYYFSLILYFLFLIFFFSLSLPGVTIVVLASGFFFGFIAGFIINIFSITVGSLIFIFISKTILKKLFNKYYKKYSSKLTNIIKDSSYEYLILFRLIIGPPLLIQNLCLSLLKISKFKFFLSTFIGFTPIMLFFSYIGSYFGNFIELKSISLSDILSKEFILILFIIIFFIILRIKFKKK